MIKGKELFDLLPQSSPMLMIDTLVSSDSEKTETKLTVTKENIFYTNNTFRETGIIENMAQTAAVRSGFEAKKNNISIKTGYIASIKNLIINYLPSLNQTLTTKVIQKSEIGNISLIQSIVSVGEKQIAECEMTIILLDD